MSTLKKLMDSVAKHLQTIEEKIKTSEITQKELLEEKERLISIMKRLANITEPIVGIRDISNTKE